MTLAAENIALKAENARLRKALESFKKYASHKPGNEISFFRFLADNARKQNRACADTAVWDTVTDGLEAIAQPTPTTPVTDKAQAVINAACAHHINSHYGGPDLLCDCGICKAVEAYRGGA